MLLLILLAIPLTVAIVGYFLSKGELVWWEGLVQLAVGCALVGLGYWGGKYINTKDTEIYSGWIAKKEHQTTSCCHSYDCNCVPICTTNGEGNVSCSELCDTCYRHPWDEAWMAEDSNGHTVFSDRCNPPGTAEPARWTQIQLNEPTAEERSYVNYIKGAPGRFFKRQDLLEKYRGKLPAYPKVYDIYRIDRFIFAALGEGPDLKRWNQELAELNGRLGAKKEVGIILIVSGEPDPDFADAVSELWLGGKKNDFIVVVGAPRYPTIAWAKVVSWSSRPALHEKVEAALAGKEFDGSQLIATVGQLVEAEFVRTPMNNWKYLMAEIEPPTWCLVVLALLGLLVSAVLQAVFWRNGVRRNRG